MKKNVNDIKSKNVILDNYFLNVNFLITKACTHFKFCLFTVHIQLEGTVSQIFSLDKNRETFFYKFCKHNFLSYIKPREVLWPILPPLCFSY